MAQNTTVRVESPNVKYSDDYIESEVDYQTSFVTRNGEEITVVPVSRRIGVQTARAAGRVGVMIVGWGGNNGSTLTAALLAHRRTPPPTWRDRRGEHSPNWYGSVTQCGTVCVGVDDALRDVYAPLSSLLPFARPQDIVIDGWDINDANLGEAMRRARVLEPALQDQLYEEMAQLKPRPGVYKPDFIAANQIERANNVLGGSRRQQYERVRADIREFRAAHQLDSVLVLWTANTERLCAVAPGVHATSDGLDHALLHHDHDELSPSTVYALAAVDEGCVYINGSPQNSVVPGVVERARRRHGAHVAGDDFKTGQTKLKSVLVDYLVQAGIKPVSIVSYNHLGNNDGKNLSAPKQFHSKEVSKRSVVDDMVESNRLLYREGERPDHTVVIQYVPYVGDVKRAMDEYVCELMLGGTTTLAVYSTCEDSLLAAAVMLDLVLVAQLLTRMRFRDLAPGAGEGAGAGDWERVDAVLSPLGYWLKAPLEGAGGGGVVNALGRQRALIDNLARLALALPPNSQLRLEQYVPPVIRAAQSGEMRRAAAAATAAAPR